MNGFIAGILLWQQVLRRGDVQSPQERVHDGLRRR